MDMDNHKEYIYMELFHFDIISIFQDDELIKGNDIIHNSDNFDNNDWIYIPDSIGIIKMDKKLNKISSKDYYILNDFKNGFLFYKKGIEDDSLRIEKIDFNSIDYSSFLPNQ